MISNNLLKALLSPDKDIRSQAETAFQSMAVVDRIHGLLGELSSSSNDTDCQLIAAVLLRRDILKLTNADQLQQIVSPLLQAFRDSSCRPQVGHCLSEVCACLSIFGDVNPVMQIILSSLETSMNDVVTLKLLAQLADRAPVAFTQLAMPSLPNLFQNVTLSTSAMEALTEVFVNAAIATTIETVELVRAPINLDDLMVDPNSAAAVLGKSSLMPHILPWLSQCQDENALLAALQHLSEASVTCPSFFAATIELLESSTKVLLNIAGSSSSEVRLAALQVLASLLSVGDVKRRVLPASLASTIINAALPLCGRLLVEGAEISAEEWALEPAALVDDGFDGEEDFLFAESLTEEFLQHLGAPALTVMLPLVQQLLESNDWKQAHAGLAVLECTLTATPVSIATHIDVVANAAASLALSQNPRVQYRAIRLLGVICEVQMTRETHVKLILERLAVALASPCTKVSATASLSLVSFFRCSEEIASQTAPFLSDILTAIVRGPLSLSGTDSGSVTTRVRAMGATACIAEAVGESFTPYYPTIMPGLLSTAQLPVVDLAGSAVEAATIVGQAVGKDVFQADAKQLLSWILPAVQTNPLEQLLLACARIASVLEEDFAPHADAVMPLLLMQAQQPPDVSIMEGDDASNPEDETDDSMTVAVPGKGVVKVTINTSKIIEKAQAARAVYELSKAMGATFGPWVERSMNVFLPLVNFTYSADVRSTSAQTLSAVFDAACVYGEEAGNMQLAQHYLPVLVETISKQIVVETPTDLEALFALGDSLSEVLYIVSRYRSSHAAILNNYSLANAEAAVDVCICSLRACLERRSKMYTIVSGKLTGEDEKEEYKDLLAQEEKLLTPLVDSIGYNLKFFCEDFIPLFEKMVEPVLGPSLGSISDIRSTISAVLLFDDCVEHCGPGAAAKYAPQLLQGILLAFSTEEKDLVQAAVYGVAQIARKAPSVITMEHCVPIVQKLLELSSTSKEEAGDSVYLIEIACSALAALTLYGPYPDVPGISRDTLVQSFISRLPIQQDDDEAKICHGQFCNLVESGSIDLSANAGRVMEIIGTILSDVEDGEDVATPETVARLSLILVQMQQNLPATTMQHSFCGLNSNAQNIVSAVLQNVA